MRSSHRRAACSVASSVRPSPSGVNGNTLLVSHRAPAAAPAREHSRLISPRCRSSDVKYVYGESCT
jgi:hypothetical protein